MTGILAHMAAGAGSGGFKAAGEIADTQIEDRQWNNRQAVLDARAKSLLEIQQRFAGDQNALNRDHQSSLAKESREASSIENKLNRELQSNLADRRDAADDARLEKTLAAKEDAPTEMEKNYSLLVRVYGEDRARSMLADSKGGKSDIERRKLYGKVYTDTLKALGGEMGEIPPGAEEKARAIAEQVSGFTAQARAGQSDLDTLLAKIVAMGKSTPRAETTDGAGPAPREAQKLDGQVKSAGILSLGSGGNDSPPLPSITGSKGFQDSMDTLVENSGGYASPAVKQALQITKGSFNPQDETITFKPQDESALKQMLQALNKAGIYFDAKEGPGGVVTVKIIENNQVSVKA